MLNHKIGFLIIAAMATLFVMSCAPTPVESSAKVRTFSRDYNVVFDAIIRYCNSNNYPISMADKSNGIINTDLCPIDLAQSSSAKRGQNKITFTIHKKTDSSTTVMAQYFLAGGYPEEYDGIDKDYYNTLFGAIAKFFQ